MLARRKQIYRTPQATQKAVRPYVYTAEHAERENGLGLC